MISGNSNLEQRSRNSFYMFQYCEYLHITAHVKRSVTHLKQNNYVELKTDKNTKISVHGHLAI